MFPPPANDTVHCLTFFPLFCIQILRLCMSNMLQRHVKRSSGCVDLKRSDPRGYEKNHWTLLFALMCKAWQFFSPLHRLPIFFSPLSSVFLHIQKNENPYGPSEDSTTLIMRALIGRRNLWLSSTIITWWQNLCLAKAELSYWTTPCPISALMQADMLPSKPHQSFQRFQSDESPTKTQVFCICNEVVSECPSELPSTVSQQNRTNPKS